MLHILLFSEKCDELRLDHFNCIQINTSGKVPQPTMFTPMFHTDTSPLSSNGCLFPGNIIHHLCGHNAIISNSLAFEGITKVPLSFDNLKKHKQVFAELIKRFGLIKKPGFSYRMYSLCSYIVKHAVLNNKAVAEIYKDYNKYILKELGEKNGEIFKIKADAKQILKEITRSLVVRNTLV